MHTHSENTNDNKINAAAGATAQLQGDVSISQPVAQTGLKEMIGNSPQVRQMRTLQAMADSNAKLAKQNNTGMPGALKAGVEQLSGLQMDDVKVHYNSAKPAQLNAHAYAQGTDIHIAPGQEQHLPHEAWHVVQQKRGQATAGVAQLKERGANPYGYQQGNRQTAHHILPHSLIVKILGSVDADTNTATRSHALPAFAHLTLGMMVTAADAVLVLDYATELHDDVKYEEGKKIKGAVPAAYQLNGQAGFTDLGENEKLSERGDVKKVKFIPKGFADLTPAAKTSPPTALNMEGFGAFKSAYDNLKADDTRGTGGNAILAMLLDSYSEWAGGNQFFGPKSEARAEIGDKDDVDEDFVGLAANKAAGAVKPQVAAQLASAKALHAEYKAALLPDPVPGDPKNKKIRADKVAELNTMLKDYFDLLNAGDTTPKQHAAADYYKVKKTADGKIHTGGEGAKDIEALNQLDGIADIPQDLKDEIAKYEKKLLRKNLQAEYDAMQADATVTPDLKESIAPLGDAKINLSDVFEALETEVKRINDLDGLWPAQKKLKIQKVQQAIAYRLQVYENNGGTYLKRAGDMTNPGKMAALNTVAKKASPNANAMKAGIYDDLYSHKTGDYITDHAYKKLLAKYRELNAAP